MKLRTPASSLSLVIAVTTIVLPIASINHLPAANNLANDAPEPVEESMHEFMEYVFQPTYKRLKASMVAKPKDKAGWKPIKADSLSLAESANLLLMRSPDEGGAAWNKFSVAVRSTGGDLYQAARAREYEAAKRHYQAMLKNCNACHEQFAGGKYQLQP